MRRRRRGSQEGIDEVIWDFVVECGHLIARRAKEDVLKHISLERLKAFVQSRGFHLFEVGPEFLIIRDDDVKHHC